MSGEGASEQGTTMVLALLRAVRALKDRLEAEGDDFARGYVLYNIAASPAPPRVSDLAELTRLDGSTVSRHVARLIEAGLVWRLPDPTDRRASRLQVSDQGMSALRRAMTRRAEVLGQATAEWTGRDRDQLALLLCRLADAIEDPEPARLGVAVVAADDGAGRPAAAEDTADDGAGRRAGAEDTADDGAGRRAGAEDTADDGAGRRAGAEDTAQAEKETA